MTGAAKMPDVTPAPSPSLVVLLVEDDLRLAGLTREYLEGHGVVVEHVADGRRTVEAALAGRFDAVLLDLMLPGKDGLEICRELRARSDVPILVLTARAPRAHPRRGPARPRPGGTAHRCRPGGRAGRGSRRAPGDAPREGGLPDRV